MPLSGTMKPNPLETSNHLMTPAISMRSVAVSSARSLTVPGRRFVPGIFDSIPSDAMTPRAAACWRLLTGASTKSRESKITPGLRTAKGKMLLAHSSVHSAVRLRISAR